MVGVALPVMPRKLGTSGSDERPHLWSALRGRPGTGVGHEIANRLAAATCALRNVGRGAGADCHGFRDAHRVGREGMTRSAYSMA